MEADIGSLFTGMQDQMISQLQRMLEPGQPSEFHSLSIYRPSPHKAIASITARREDGDDQYLHTWIAFRVTFRTVEFEGVLHAQALQLEFAHARDYGHEVQMHPDVGALLFLLTSPGMARLIERESIREPFTMADLKKNHPSGWEAVVVAMLVAERERGTKGWTRDALHGLLTEICDPKWPIATKSWLRDALHYKYIESQRSYVATYYLTKAGRQKALEELNEEMP